MAATNRQLLISESHDDLNWYTPYKGNLINMPCASRTQSAYGIPTICISRSPCITTFCVVVNRVRQILCSREKGPPTQPTARRLIGPRVQPQFLSSNSQWSRWGKTNCPLMIGYIDLPDPYLQHTINTFNTCSQVPTPRSLTDTGEGYNLGGAGFS
jgi:hypothetical protein